METTTARGTFCLDTVPPGERPQWTWPLPRDRGFSIRPDGTF